jgi:uncharacterized protein YciW
MPTRSLGRRASPSKPDLAALSGAGLSPAAIVTLSEIIRFVAYHARAVATFALLGELA